MEALLGADAAVWQTDPAPGTGVRGAGAPPAPPVGAGRKVKDR
jgi:hypothetical protein